MTLQAPLDRPKFGLYLHWPFCQAKCPYCDFNSHVVAAIDQQAWADAYCAEIARFGALTKGRTLNSVFFGGGTPSLMDPSVVHQVMDKIRATWPIANDWEVTLEANPTSVEANRFKDYRMAGVNRISMGIQSLNDDALRKLGRLHSVSEAQSAFDIARATFDRVSFDLIYARQDQGLAEWETELSRALEMAVDHLSLYQLTIEPGTAFGDRFARGGLAGLPSEDLGADMYDLTQSLCNAAGIPAYEVSNHARQGAESQHNLIYWTGGDYIGIGPGAHGRLTLNGIRHATTAESAPIKWLKEIAKAPDSATEWVALPPTEIDEEYLMMGLRINSGVAMDRLTLSAAQDAAIAELTESGFLIRTGTHLKTTQTGRLVLNAIIRELLTG
jgi:putative oxygen-independent coproporphyrinogen III oxidase